MSSSNRRTSYRHLLRRVSSAFALLCLFVFPAFAATSLSGSLTDPVGGIVQSATIRLLRLPDSSPYETFTDTQGQFFFANLSAGEYRLTAEFPGFAPVVRTLTLADDQGHAEKIQFAAISRQSELVSVTADVNEMDVLAPDPAQRVFVRQDLLDANPGHSGSPVSIPGYPIETASSGIKAPQYFAPGVAGDHGEPIAQFIAVGGYLVPNNLSANAHGNGYADPNLLIPQVLESAQIDGGAFNVREGNHSVNLAATYGLQTHLDPFLTFTGDQRDVDLAAGWSPGPESWMAFEASYGNGFLDRLEHRQQYKFNGERIFNLGEHRLTVVGLGYHGQSYIPGLVRMFAPEAGDANFPNLGDTIDPRQRDQTHTALLALNDVWQFSGSQQLQLSGFFRTYNLSLYSDFGQGLIRQSEFRTMGGGSAGYVKKFADFFSLLGGLDYEREAPRRDDLDRYGFFDPSRPSYYGTFTPIDGNNVTISSTAPYVAAEGNVSHHFRYYLGWRRDEIRFDDRDLLAPQNSFQKLVGVNSPKATLSFMPGDSHIAPRIAVSFGEAFFTEDPRIGLGKLAGTPVAKTRSYQLVANKTTHRTDIRLALGHVTNSAELAKIDPDTGLQFNQGPSRLRFITLAARRGFPLGFVQASISKADARDLESGEPTPEAPRMIFDMLGTIERLPLHLQAKGEFEFVGRKPLGTGCDPQNLNSECVGTSVKEFRGAIVRPFLNNRLDAGINFLISRGYTGQTTENFYPAAIQEVVGVRTRSYASLGFTYRFGRSR
jgi:hypothetical protein